MESAHRQESTDHNTGGVKFRALVGKGQFAVFCDGYRAESASARKRLVDVNLSIGAMDTCISNVLAKAQRKRAVSDEGAKQVWFVL